MYLSRLELFGFKSFPLKTKILFDQGITAIVGPNGCGKTNIVDALRWVLGEQKTSSLRGEKMEEVIFHGTAEMKPLGMADVTLTFDNRVGVLPVEYSEVSVTRRLFRSGESEYYINKNPCRLKDIIDLFLDTGAGAHTYSVLQREMIDIILSDQAEERRFLFEEASGISKYKRRKKAAQRKLEATKNDLLRINDIIQEVEKQVNSLKRQSQRGERFKKHKEELKQLEIKLAGYDLRRFLSSQQSLDQKLHDLEKEKRSSIESVNEKERKLQEFKAQLLDVEKELYALHREKEEFFRKTYQLEREKSVNAEKAASLTQLSDKSREQKQNLSSRLVTVKQEIEAKQRSFAQFSEKLKLKEKQNSGLESALKVAEEEYRNASEEYETVSGEFEQIEEKTKQIQTEIQNLQIQVAEVEKSCSHLREAADSVSDQLTSVSKDIAAQHSSLETHKEKMESLTNEKNALEQNLKSCELTLENWNLEYTRTESFLQSQESQLRLLDEMMVSYERHRGGGELLLGQREKFPGIIDKVSNLFTVEQGYARAIQALLGDCLDFVVCQDMESAKRGIDYLRKNKKGKVTFLILDRFNDPKSSIPASKELDKSQKWASEVMDCQREFRPLMNFVVGNALIVPSFEDALDLTSEANPGLTAVSLNGEVVKEGRIIGFGEGGGLFVEQKEKESDGAREKIKELKDKLKKIKQEKDRTQTERKRLAEAVSKSAQDLASLFEHAREKELGLNQSRIENDQMRKRSQELESQMEEIALKVDQLKKIIRKKEEKHSVLKNQRDQVLLNKEDSAKRLKQQEDSKDRIYQELNELRIETVTIQGKTEQLENEKARLGELIAEMENGIKSAEEEIQGYAQKIRQTADKSEEIQKELEKVLELKESKDGNIQSKTYVKDDCAQKVTAIEEELKQLRERKERFQEEGHTLDMERLKISNEVQKLKEKIWDEYHVDITELPPHEPEEKAQTDELVKRRDFLKERIERMGPVNLLALDEYRSQKQRLDFLQEQSQDLTGAQESLNSAILTINKTARKLFLETFDKIRVNFQKVFSGLFEGGTADLWLCDERDPLESSIGISVSPRGKKLLRLDQLSGGEKALVAISLLFGIYLVKPSPFCILDEVDAPLDDANLSRFLKLIKNLSSHTQFIIITHNKLSMEASDVLYGVTMETPGVSKLVSVRLEKEQAKSRELRVKSTE